MEAETQESCLSCLSQSFCPNLAVGTRLPGVDDLEYRFDQYKTGCQLDETQGVARNMTHEFHTWPGGVRLTGSHGDLPSVTVTDSDTGPSRLVTDSRGKTLPPAAAMRCPGSCVNRPAHLLYRRQRLCVARARPAGG